MPISSDVQLARYIAAGWQIVSRTDQEIILARPGSLFRRGKTLRLVVDLRGQLRPVDDTPGWAKALGMVVAGFMMLWALASCSSNLSRTPDPKEQARLAEAVDAERAWRYCQDAVRARLKAPATARFGGRESVDGMVVKGRDGTVAYQVVSYVDAQNSFGAMIRTEFECVVRKLPSGRWEVSAVSFRDNG